jgi:hypothetical protein
VNRSKSARSAELSNSGERRGDLSFAIAGTLEKPAIGRPARLRPAEDRGETEVFLAESGERRD